MGHRGDNELRYEPGKGGHVESYFLRGNAPDRRLAFWLKATVFAPRPDSAVAELWFVFVDGENGRRWAEKRTVPLSLASFGGDPLKIELSGAEFHLADDGAARGRIEGEGGPCTWDLRWSRAPGVLGDRLCLLPSQSMVDGSFPRSKPLTPFPLLFFKGTIELWGERIELDQWPGMQGHNWGREHAWEYAWGQAHFVDGTGEPFCWVEGFSGKIRLGGRPTPFISAMVVRRGEQEYRFDRLIDLWRQTVSIEGYTWTLKMQGPGGEAAMAMTARSDEMVCLGYHNPDGRLSYCLNSKLARVDLRVNPVNEPGFECTSEHGGALEFLRNQPDLNFERVV